MLDLEKIIIKTDSGDIDFLKVETSGQSNLCGYNAISNYIKFLPLNQRLECYKKLLSKVWNRHNASSLNPNPFAILTEELKYKLLFLEEFFKLRENGLYHDENAEVFRGEDYHSNQNSKALLNQNIDKQNFASAKRIFIEKYLDYPDKFGIQALNYEIFFKEFYLTGGVLRFSGDDNGTQKVLLDRTYNQGYSFDYDRDHNIFSYQYNFLKTSYQNWVSFLMTIGYDTESYADIFNPVRIFNDLLPHNSFIIKYPVEMIGEDQGYDLKNRYLESIYFHCQEYEEKFTLEVTALSQNFIPILSNQENFNEIALATNFSQFNHASQFNLQNYQRILNCAYLYILKSLECSTNQAQNDEDTEARQIEKKANISIFKHFYLKEDYNKFFNISEHEMQLACGRVFSYLFNLEPYRKLLIEVSEFTTAELVEFIKIKDFSKIQNRDHKTQLEGLNQKYLQIQEIFKIVLAYFKKENSFERQYFHAINSDPLIVSNPNRVHYTSYIASTKIQNPFPEHDSLQTLYLQSLSTKDFKKEISQTLSHFIDREAEKLNSQSLSARPDLASQFPSPLSRELSPSSSPTINTIQQSSSLFQKLKGRQDDNLRYQVSESESGNRPIHERMSLAIKNSKEIISVDGVASGINDDEILLAMLLAKNFGGIGTKSDQIFSAERNHLDRERQALVNLLFNRKGDGSKEINLDLFNKLVNFSANFQIQCKELGIYSGNKTIDERIFSNERNIETRHGLRLAFIPDEFLLEYLNKPGIEEKYKDVAKNLIAKNIKQRQSPSQQAGRC